MHSPHLLSNAWVGARYLELVRGAGAAADGKRVGHMVAEGGKVGVLLHSHELHGVVPQAGYPRQHIVCSTRGRSGAAKRPSQQICESNADRVQQPSDLVALGYVIVPQ